MSKKEIAKTIIHQLSGFTRPDNGVSYRNATAIMQSFTPSYNKKVILEKIAARDGVSVEEAAKNLKENNLKSLKIGNSTHSFAQYVFNNRDRIHTLVADESYHSGVLRYWKTLHDDIVPLFSELKLFHNDYRFVGMMDLLIYDRSDNSISIVDYKTNADIYSGFSGYNMRKPFDKLGFSAHSKYIIELSLYKLLLQQGLKRLPINLKIVWILPTGSIIKMDLDDYTDVLRNNLENESIQTNYI